MTVTMISYFFFFFNDTATTEIYTLSLHDALPISWAHSGGDEALYERLADPATRKRISDELHSRGPMADRKSTRLNSSHSQISYAVFCLKKKKNKTTDTICTKCHYDIS